MKKPQSMALSLFYGKIDEQELFPFPSLSEDEKSFAQEMSDAIKKYFEKNVNSEKMDHESLIPDEIYEGLKDLGLYGLAVEEDNGGMGLNYSMYARIFEEICRHDASVAVMLGAHQSIGYRALVNDGNEEQKKKWLPLLTSGEKLAAFCLTEPGSGSDAYSIKTKAIKDKNGDYILNGQKLWITNGGKADFYTVFAKTDHEKNGKKLEKISTFIVEKEMDGLSFGSKEDKMGIRASETRAVYFDKVKVPKENLIGEAGKGFKIAMKVLNSGRLSLGSGCVGGMKELIQLATLQSKNRKQFGDSIINYGMIQEKLAYMSARAYATESLVYLSTGQIDKGLEDYQLESAICKIYGSESLWIVVDQAMQIAAGNGYMKEYPYERLMRDTRINLIFEGTNEILRIFIALSGLNELGKSLSELGAIKDVSSALKDPIKSVGILSDFALNRLEKIFITKTLKNIDERIKDESDELIKMVSKFSIKAEDVLMKYGKNIIGNEFVQARIANMLIQLTVALAVISRTNSILSNAEISDEDKKQALNLTKIIFKENKSIFMSNLKKMSTNLDKNNKSVSEYLKDKESYGFDIIKF